MSVSRHFLLQAPQCPCSVRKWFSRDHCCRGRSKPGCRIVGSLPLPEEPHPLPLAIQASGFRPPALPHCFSDKSKHCFQPPYLLLFTCSRVCVMAKVVKNQKKPSKPGIATSARDSPVSKPVKADPPQMLQPFRRPDALKVAILTVY